MSHTGIRAVFGLATHITLHGGLDALMSRKLRTALLDGC